MSSVYALTGAEIFDGETGTLNSALIIDEGLMTA